MAMDWTTVTTAALSALGGGGLWAVVKAAVDKKKSPYDRFMEVMDRQEQLCSEIRAELAEEREDSAAKSHVIAQAAKCPHRFKDPASPCPVDAANDERLKRICKLCKEEGGND